MDNYRFGDVVEINGLSANQLKRWTQIGLIVPKGAGAPTAGWRKFTFRNLVEARVCEELRALNVAESLLFEVVKQLNRAWDGTPLVLTTAVDNVPAKVASDVPVYHLWIARVHFEAPDGTPMPTNMIAFVDPERLAATLTSEGMISESGVGIVIPISRMIADLERITGDVFDIAGAIVKGFRKGLEGPSEP